MQEEGCVRLRIKLPSIAGARIQIRAMTDIAADEQLTVSYTNLMEPRARRQADLLRSKHFACACLRCRQPLAESPDRLLEVRRAPSCPPFGRLPLNCLPPLKLLALASTRLTAAALLVPPHAADSPYKSHDPSIAGRVPTGGPSNLQVHLQGVTAGCAAQCSSLHV